MEDIHLNVEPNCSEETKEALRTALKIAASSLSNDSLSPSGLVLVEQARLCCHFEVPKSLIEIDRLLWKAFDLGKKYRDAGGTE